jgi:20S proteasome subunit beta 2
MGSGSLAAISVFETEWRENMSESEGCDLVQKAILAGIFNDLGSGSSCDTCVIRMDGTVDFKRGAVTPNDVGVLRAAIHRSSLLTMQKGTTPILSSVFHRSAKKGAAITLADVTVTPMET